MFSFLSIATVTVSSHSNRNLKTPFLLQVVFSHDALFIMATETKTKTWGFLVQYSSYCPEKVSFTELEAELMTNKLQWFSCLHTHQSTGVITPPPGLFIYLIYLCRDQRSPCKNQFCPSIMWVQVWTQVFMLCNTHPYLLSRLQAPGMAFHMNELGSSCLHSKCSHPLSHLPNLPLLEPIVFEDKILPSLEDIQSSDQWSSERGWRGGLWWYPEWCLHRWKAYPTKKMLRDLEILESLRHS